MSHPALGKLAPSFNLFNQKGEKISLSSFKGKQNVVLYFYPRAMTPGCTVQACGIRDSAKELKKLDTVVLGVSTDSVEKLLKFEAKEKLNFDLLSDPEHAVAEKYGVWGKKKFMGKESIGLIRSTFIIGKDGKLVFVFPKVNTKTHAEDVIDYIKENLSN